MTTECQGRARNLWPRWITSITTSLWLNEFVGKNDHRVASLGGRSQVVEHSSGLHFTLNPSLRGWCSQTVMDKCPDLLYGQTTAVFYIFLIHIYRPLCQMFAPIEALPVKKVCEPLQETEPCWMYSKSVYYIIVRSEWTPMIRMSCSSLDADFWHF